MKPYKWYKDLVKKNPQIIQNLDLLLYLVVWSPSRWSSSELGYEIYHAAVGLLSVFHQYIIEEGKSGTSCIYAYLLDAIDQLETLVEIRGMHLESVTNRMSRYSPLLGLEIIKSVLKTLVWRHYGSHIYVRHPEHCDLQLWSAQQAAKEVLTAQQNMAKRALSDDLASGALGVMAAGRAVVCWCASLTGRPTMSEACEPSTSSSFAFSHALTQHSAASSAPLNIWSRFLPSSRLDRASTASITSAAVFAAEVVHIWRPVIYVWMLRKSSLSSRRLNRENFHPWWPWLTSLFLDIASVGVQAAAQPRIEHVQYQQRHTRSSSLLSLVLVKGLMSGSFSESEEAECMERRRRLLLYLLRNPAYDNYTRVALLYLQSKLCAVPVLNMGVDYLVGLLSTLSHYYTYTSGSS